MDTIKTLGTDIPTTFGPTYEAYTRLLTEPSASSAIHSTTKQEYSYGSHPRQKLDLYTPSSFAPQTAAPRPVLLFLYGGAFVSGDKVLPNIPGGVAYTNVGHFFAEKLGFNTVVMDYRLVGERDQARYPSGGEDVDLVLKWVNKHFEGKNDVFVLANSAGAVHFMTWLFADQFKDARERSVRGGAEGVCKLQGVALLGAPYRLDPEGGMKPMLEGYFGVAENTRAAEPTALMQKAIEKQSPDDVAAWPRTLVVVSELDPEEHIVKPAQEYLALWQQKGGRGDFHEIKGHNHLSPPLSLGTGVEREEIWGYEVGQWFLS